MEAVSEFIANYGELFLEGTWVSILMTLISVLFAYVLGTPIGVLLTITSPKGLHPHKALNAVLGWIVNIGRSIPFIILMVALIPFTRLIVGTSLGVKGACVPLIITATPFVARMVEQSLSEVSSSLIEAAQSFGASTGQIVLRVLLKESLPSLIRGMSITLVTLFGFVAMAGTVGAGGLGDIAIRYGYQRFMPDVMIVSIILCVIIVQIFQSVGDLIARKVDKRS